MKKIILCFVAVIMVLSLNISAFGKTEKSISESASGSKLDESKLTEQSKIFAGQMAEGEFEPVTELFADAIKKQFTPEALKSAWDVTVKDIGAYVGVYESKIETANGNTIVYVILSYEKNGLIISFLYEPSGKIGGLRLNYYSIPAELEINEMFEEHAIQIGEGDLKVDGILTLPTGETKNIAILVQGSGQHDMDETIGAAGNKPFRDIAHGLAEKGIASVRYNKRYYQHAALAPEDITIQDEVLDDVSLAIEFIKSDERVQNMKITLIGHSLGGMLAPKLALDNDEITAAVILAGSPRGLEDIILDQNLAAIEKMDFESEDVKNNTINMVETEINRIKNIEAEKEGTKIMGIGLDYWRSLNEIDTPEICDMLDIPFLIMQGGADFQVYPDIDFEAWKTVFEDKNNAEFKLYDNLNHLFMPTMGIVGIADYDEANNVDQQVIEDMAAWITGN